MSSEKYEYEKQYDHLFKIGLLGDKGSGKTNLILRYTDDAYNPTYAKSIDVDFKIKTEIVSDFTIKNQVWDDNQPDRFRTIANNSLRGLAAIIVTVDMTNRDSFNNLDKWLQDIDRNANEGVAVVIAATKFDDIGNRKVSVEEIEDFAKAVGYPCHFVSAKTDKGVKELFQEADCLALAKIDPDYCYDPSKKLASSDDKKVLIKLIKDICNDLDYWKPKVRKGYGVPANNNVLPDGVAKITLNLATANSKKPDLLLEGIGNIADSKYSHYFQGIHSLFRGRDENTNRFYGILSQLAVKDGELSKTTIDKVMRELQESFPKQAHDSNIPSM